MRNSHALRRFSGRAEAYRRYRPRYPGALVELLREEIGLVPEWVVADVGSGTGLSSEPFLRHGNRVYGVEPNPEMRAAAETFLGAWPGFTSVEGTAEATTLADDSVELVVAGQAFHWFDPGSAREEFRRILRAGGWAVVLWNRRRTASTPFLRAFEELLLRYGTDYRRVRHERVGPGELASFFGGGFARRLLYNEQVLDGESLAGRVESVSYAPPAGHPRHAPMVEELRRVFDRHQEEGRVKLEYDTEIYFGRV